MQIGYYNGPAAEEYAKAEAVLGRICFVHGTELHIYLKKTPFTWK